MHRRNSAIHLLLVIPMSVCFVSCLPQKIGSSFVQLVREIPVDSTLFDAAYSPDGRYALVGGHDAADLWELSTGALAHRYKRQTGSIQAVAFSPDGEMIATAAGDGTVCIWQTQTGQLLHNHHENRAYVRSVSFSPDGLSIASGDDSGSVVVWDIQERKTRFRTSGLRGSINAIDFTPSGDGIVTGGDDGVVRVWNAHSGELQLLINLRLGWNKDVDVSPCEEYILSSYVNWPVILSDLHTGRELGRFKRDGSGPQLRMFQSICFGRHSGIALLGSHSGGVTLWNVSKWKEIAYFLAHKDNLEGVAFAPEGPTFITIGSDGNGAYSIRHWRVQEELLDVPPRVKKGGEPEIPQETSPEAVVSIADENLEKCLRLRTGKVTGPLAAGDLLSVTDVSCAEAGIQSLSGLQFCQNLVRLSLPHNKIDDLTPLSGMEKLSVLNLCDNKIEDLSQLPCLKDLTYLDLSKNRIRNASPLACLSGLSYLNLADNEIEDVGCLNGLKDISVLDLRNNRFSDINDLINNPGFGPGDSLYLQGNHLSFISRVARTRVLEGVGVRVYR